MNIFGKIQEMQAKMAESQEALKDVIVEAESGGGMVVATANGQKKILNVKIDNTIIDKNDPEILEDLVVAAVNKALEKAGEVAAEEIKKTTAGSIPNIPGLDLSKFGL